MNEKELFRIVKKEGKYILYVLGKAELESENIDLITAEIFRINIL